MENKKIEVDAWFQEKVLRSFVDLALGAINAKELRDSISKSESLVESEKGKIQFLADNINGDVWIAVQHLIKILAILREPIEKNTSDDFNEIWNKGTEGLANVMIKHGFREDLLWLGLSGLSSEEKATKQKREEEFWSEINSLIQSSSRANRTEVFDKLWNSRHIQKVKFILDLLEPVNNGEKVWEDFQKEVQVLLADEVKE
ncbi:MAG: hypothetical protein M3033_12250 [Acidobacteriota bacterium]|nr:hypothetical protein [Acidobacteriota bacterium]